MDRADPAKYGRGKRRGTRIRIDVQQILAHIWMTSASNLRTDGKTSGCNGFETANMPYARVRNSMCSSSPMYIPPDTRPSQTHISTAHRRKGGGGGGMRTGVAVGNAVPCFQVGSSLLFMCSISSSTFSRGRPSEGRLRKRGTSLWPCSSSSSFLMSFSCS